MRREIHAVKKYVALCLTVFVLLASAFAEELVVPVFEWERDLYTHWKLDENGHPVNAGEHMLDDAMFYGRGAGKLPTASAVVSDVVDCARHIGKTVMCFWEDEDVKLASIDNVSRKFFVRADKSKADEAKVKEVFGNVEFVSVASITDEVAFVTEVMTEKEFKEKAESLNAVISRIRIEE